MVDIKKFVKKVAKKGWENLKKPMMPLNPDFKKTGKLFASKEDAEKSIRNIVGVGSLESGGIRATGEFLKKGLMRPESQQAAKSLAEMAKKAAAERGEAIPKAIQKVVEGMEKAGRTGFKPGSAQQKVFEKLLDLQRRGFK